MVVFHRPGDKQSGVGVFPPVVDFDGGQVAEHDRQGFALRPVVRDLSAQPCEASRDVSRLYRALVIRIGEIRIIVIVEA